MQKYEVLGVIGEGAYGVVLRCKNNQTKEVVAIKKFKQTEEDASVKKTTMREVKVLRMLSQPNIVQLKEAFRKKGIVCLVFEYVQNNLLEVLEKSPSGLDPELIRTCMYQLIKGLAYMHSLGIIHRDIKPQNLLVSQKKVLKICDFGFARPIKRNDDNEELTDYVATRWYRPPQLLVGAKYGKQIDLWAVGCIMGELIDGMPMFPGENQIDQLFLIQKCLGSLTPDHYEIFLKNPRFLGMKFPEISSLNTIEKRYLGKLTQKGLNFVKSLLKMQPTQRLTALEALKHPYFDGVREQDFVRRLQTNTKTQQRVISASSHKQQPQSTVLTKKSYASPYNPLTFTEKHQQQHHFNQHIAKNGKIQFKKQSRDSTRKNEFAPPTVPAGIHSKSVNKNTGIKPKSKNISLQKHRNMEALAKTQGGFYIHPVEGIIHQKGREEEEDSNTFIRINKIYGQKNHVNVQPTNRPSKGIVSTTEQVQQQDEFGSVFQSTGQLPFLIMGKDKAKSKEKNNINIVLNQNTYNYKTTHNHN